MKNLTILCFLLLLYSCAPVQYFQVFKTSPEGGTLSNNQIIFEDENCKVSLDLWADHGDNGFYILNKTDTDIVIDLSKSFFVMNGYARPFYPNRVLATDPVAPYIEVPERTIPPKAMISFTTIPIWETRLIRCDFIDRPSNKEIQVLKFDKSNSPIDFYNLITYSKNDVTKRIETSFFVSEVTNIPPSKMFDDYWYDECGKKLGAPIKTYIPYAADKFYIKYGFYTK